LGRYRGRRAAVREAVAGPSGDEVQFPQKLRIQRQAVAFRRAPRRQRPENALHLRLLLRRKALEVVVELDHGHRLDEGGDAAAGMGVDDAANGAHRVGAHREDVAAAPLRYDRLAQRALYFGRIK
jgi:hypothetical protein